MLPTESAIGVPGRYASRDGAVPGRRQIRARVHHLPVALPRSTRDEDARARFAADSPQARVHVAPAYRGSRRLRKRGPRRGAMLPRTPSPRVSERIHETITRFRPTRSTCSSGSASPQRYSALGSGACSPIMSARVRHERFANPCAIRQQAATARPEVDAVVLEPKPPRATTCGS